jgi:hypothetical protein
MKERTRGHGTKAPDGSHSNSDARYRGAVILNAFAALVMSSPGWLMAQSSPFMTGATALQSNILILRCSASERGGTSSFASQLIGQREVIRTTESRSTQPLHFLPTVSHTEHVNIEYAVLDSEIEQLPDLRGFLKLASTPFWRRVALSPPESRLETEQLSHVRTLAARAWELFRGHSGAASQAGRSAGEEGMARRRYASGAKGGRAPDNFDR